MKVKMLQTIRYAGVHSRCTFMKGQIYYAIPATNIPTGGVFVSQIIFPGTPQRYELSMHAEKGSYEVIEEDRPEDKTMEKLQALARDAHNGACNPIALIIELGNILNGAYGDSFSQDAVRSLPEVKIIIGQISFLIGESLGPTEKALNDYENKTGDIKI